MENEIINWVRIDNDIKLLNDKLKNYRQKRKYLAKNILDNLENKVIRINDDVIKRVETKYTPPLTLSYIDECLSKFIPDSNNKEYLMEYIKSNRPSKSDYDIKRYVYN